MKNEDEIALAAETIRRGELVAFPTETVYGLGANAFDASAVAKVFELKGRPRFDPLIVHVSEPATLHDLVENVPPLASELVSRFWPGPLSLVLPKRDCIPDIVTAGLPNVAVRCPAHPIARRLIAASGVPIAAPSANRFCAVSPTTAQHVADQFGDQLTRILDGGPCEVGLESTVISFVDEQPVLLRPGGVTAEELQGVVGPLKVVQDLQGEKPSSPGQLPRHYAPSTPLVITTDPPSKGEKVGLLAFGTPRNVSDYAAVESLSEKECLHEAAANLFAAMRRLDSLQLDYIAACPVPEVGIGNAIMDRLRRAAAK